MINFKRALVATTTSLALVAAAQAAPVVTTSAAGAGTAASETVATTLVTAVQASNSGINIVTGTARYTGAADQGGTYTGFIAGGITQADGIV